MKSIAVENLSPEVFRDFGKILTVAAKRPAAENEEITYWDRVAELNLGEMVSTGILEVYSREMEASRMERHLSTPEILVGLDGDSAVLFGKPGSAPGEDLRAFMIHQGEAVVMHPGTWHWSPFPLQKSGRLLVVFKSGTPDNDLDIRPLPEKIRITVKSMQN